MDGAGTNMNVPWGSLETHGAGNWGKNEVSKKLGFLHMAHAGQFKVKLFPSMAVRVGTCPLKYSVSLLSPPLLTSHRHPPSPHHVVALHSLRPVLPLPQPRLEGSPPLPLSAAQASASPEDACKGAHSRRDRPACAPLWSLPTTQLISRDLSDAGDQHLNR